MTLPIKPPYPPMEALLVSEIPAGENWEYEPKWDGFRCLAFRDGKTIELQSKSGQVALALLSRSGRCPSKTKSV